MGPEITNNNSGKTPYAFSNSKQQQFLNILNVVIMMWMTCGSYAILRKCWHDKIWGICHRGGNKRGATAMITKRCHGNVPVPVTRLRYWCKGEVCGCVQKMVGRSQIPGIPRVDDGDKAKEGQHAPTIWARSKHEHLIHHTCISSRAVVSRLYLRSVH